MYEHLSLGSNQVWAKPPQISKVSCVLRDGKYSNEGRCGHGFFEWRASVVWNQFLSEFHSQLMGCHLDHSRWCMVIICLTFARCDDPDYRVACMVRQPFYGEAVGAWPAFQPPVSSEVSGRVTTASHFEAIIHRNPPFRPLLQICDIDVLDGQI